MLFRRRLDRRDMNLIALTVLEFQNEMQERSKPFKPFFARVKSLGFNYIAREGDIVKIVAWAESQRLSSCDRHDGSLRAKMYRDENGEYWVEGRDRSREKYWINHVGRIERLTPEQEVRFLAAAERIAELRKQQEPDDDTES